MLVAFFIPLGFAISSFFFCWPRNWCEITPPRVQIPPTIRAINVPDIGLRIAFIGQEQSEQHRVLGFSMPLSAVVLEVESSRPRFRAGLRAGDVIVAIDDRNIGGEDDLLQAIQKGGPGTRFLVPTWE